MKIVVAIDSFKGSLSTFEAAEAVKEGALAAFPEAEVVLSPLADGGEGTVEAITAGMGGVLHTVRVSGPLGEPVDAVYGVLPETKTAIIEMASAAGLPLVPPEKRCPLYTTTYGVGEVILHAMKESGCRKFIIGIGGSATNDGGVGMLSALGFSFLDAEGNEIPRGACGIASLAAVNAEVVPSALYECEFRIACDVTNPLCGERGASAVYGPQKGATPSMVRDMDAWLSKYAQITEKCMGKSFAEAPGAGAAGGLGFAFLSYLSGKLSSGIDLVMECTGLERHLSGADIVITGEGRLDGQSCMGKAPVGVASLAKKYGKPVIAFCGCVGDGAELCNEHGIDAFFPILDAPCTGAEAMEKLRAHRNLKNTAEQVLRLVRTTSFTAKK